jgi:protein TonB
MKRHGRALTESLVLHGILVVTLIVLARVMPPPAKIVRLDFSLQQTAAPAPDVSRQAAKTEPAMSEATPAPPVPQPETRKVDETPPQRLEAAVAKIRHTPVPVKPAPEQPAQESLAESATEDSPLAAPEAPAPSGNAAVGADRTPGPAVAAEAYRQANYTAIRDSILGNLQYPMMARRRGWSGQVEVSFTVNPDGNVNDLKILTSSGFPLLDEQAMTAIRRSSPFIPPPPMTVELVMPVTFRLN